MTDVSVCVVKSLLVLQFFSDSDESWHTWSRCQLPMCKKTAEQLFRILILKLLVIFIFHQ